MKMRTHATSKLLGIFALVFLAGLAVHGQQQEIEDQDLLDLLEQVNQKSTVPESEEIPSVDPIPEVVESVDPVVENAAEGDEMDMAKVADDDRVDDLTMVTYDDTMGSSYENLISVRLNRVGLEEAINLFAQLSGANIIVPELTEAAQISVNLKDVEWRPALQSILDTYSYELYQRVSGSNVYSVRRRPVGAPEPQVVETFLLKFATVPNVAKLIRALLPEDAKVSEFASRNMIVVKSTESGLSEVRAVLDSIDTVRQQVFIESKFMELSDDAQKDLGIDWSVLQSYSAGTRGDTTYSYTDNDSDLRTETRLRDISGNPYEEAQGYAEFKRGGSPLAPWTLEGVTPKNRKVTTDGSSEVFTSVLTADEFRLILSALEQKKGVNVVSNPKVIVANEEPANISIIRREPNLKQERQQTASGLGGAAIDNIVYSLDPDLPFFDFGIKLEVLPSINTSSNITVRINPSLTRKFGEKIAGDNTYPIIDEKSIQTVFNLASGQTAAIGGLTEVTEAEEERKVPVLGSIPYLGRLFSWKQTIRGQNETIIFVTVGLANTQDIDSETGMPGDAELARRQVIKDRNGRKLREQGRQYYQAGEDEKLQDMMELMRRKEQKRIDDRERTLQKEAEKAAKRAAKDNKVAARN
jgi:type II secretory pathway component GspD/PulD (secretin)